jgi:hypothetical protein
MLRMLVDIFEFPFPVSYVMTIMWLCPGLANFPINIMSLLYTLPYLIIHPTPQFTLHFLRLLMPPIIPISIRPSTLLHIPLLLIKLLTLLTPLRRLILARLFLLVAFLLHLVESLWVVFRGTVNCDKLERLGLGGVDELVLSPGWDYDNVGGFDVLG